MSQIRKLSSGSGNATVSAVTIEDVKNNGSSGGTFTAGSFVQRPLNTLTDPDGIVSLSSNRFTLQDGNYLVMASAPGYQVSLHKAILVEDPAGTPTTVAIGSSEFCNNGREIQNRSFLNMILEISGGPKTYEIQHRSSVTVSTNGFGIPSSFGVNEVYTQVYILKLSN